MCHPVANASLSVIAALMMSLPAAAEESNAIVKWNAEKQQIDGFGGSGAFRQAENLTKLPPEAQQEVLDLLFSTTKGAGLSILRNNIGDGGLTAEGKTWGTESDGPVATIEPKEGEWNWTGDEAQVYLMKEAKKRGCTTFISAAWSPPAWMKTNNSVINGGSLRKDKYRAYAEYLAEYVNGYKKHHDIDIHAVSPQNEPTFTGGYSCCQWSPEDFLELTKNHIIPVFKEKNVAAKFMLGEHMFWDEGFAAPSLNDPVACGRVDIVAAHGYGNPNGSGVLPLATAKGKRIWETEVYNNADESNNREGKGTIENALYWAEYIHKHMTISQANAWLYWWCIAKYQFEGTLITVGASPDAPNNSKPYSVYPRLFAIGNFSRFVRPGWLRIDATPQPVPGVLVSAYKDKKTGDFAVVVINKNAAEQVLALTLEDAKTDAFTPYRTSRDEKLDRLPEIKPDADGLAVKLAPQSVTTFVGKVKRP